MQFSKDWTYATTCTCFVILFDIANPVLISSDSKTYIEIVLTNVIHILSHTQFTWSCGIFLQNQRKKKKHFLAMEEPGQTQDPFHISACIRNCSWCCKACIRLIPSSHRVKQSRVLHDAAAWSQPRKAVVRHLLARGHSTQMGNSLQRVPTCKMYNPRWKQRAEKINGSPNKINH